MPLMSAPVTPEGTPFVTRAGLRRSFTVPPKLNPAKPATVEIGAAAGIETLYVHPAAKVVSFNTSPAASRPSSSSSSAGVEGVDGSLPWTSPTERTLAAGPLEIYRVPGSVSFLHSGSLLHAIMPRSQCWCVDGSSKFAFRVLPNQYYRIELPGETEEDKELVEHLKVTLAKVLYYERTACPFQRGFNVGLPEMLDIKERRKSHRLSSGPAKRWTFDQKWKPEGAEDDEDYDSSRPSSVCISDAGRSEFGLEPGNRSQENLGPSSVQALTPPGPPRGVNSIRSVTAPPQLSLRSSPSSKVPQMVGLIDEAVARNTPTRKPAPTPTTLPPTPESMQDEFTQIRRGVAESLPEDDSPREISIIVPCKDLENEDSGQISTPKSTQPLYLQIEDEPDNRTDALNPSLPLPVATPESRHPTYEASDEIVVGSADLPLTEESPIHKDDERPDEEKPASKVVNVSPNPSIESSSSLDSWSSFPPTTPENLRSRRGYASTSSNSSYQSLASSLGDTSLQRTSVKQQQQQQQTHFTGTGALLVRKTCAMFLGPPAHLVTLMLQIAAQIMAGRLGEFGMSVPVLPPRAIRGHRRVPGSWDMSDDEEEWGM